MKGYFGTLLLLQGEMLGLGPVRSNGVSLGTHGYLSSGDTSGLSTLSVQFPPGLESTTALGDSRCQNMVFAFLQFCLKV